MSEIASHKKDTEISQVFFFLQSLAAMSRSKIDKVTLNALRTRQSLVKGERLVRHEMRAVLLNVAI